jgi:hypothetical protein
VPDVSHKRFAPGPKKKTVSPAIPRVVPSLQPPVALQAVEGSDQNHRLKIGELCQMHLSDSFVID